MDEAIVRRKIESFKDLLPSTKGKVHNPPNPIPFSPASLHEIPNNSKKSTIPWIPPRNDQISLSDELRMFAAYVSVSLSSFGSLLTSDIS
jgi:hypothetical protein